MIDLSQWVPPYILDIQEDAAGEAVTAIDWNSLWNRHREQGDNQSETIRTMLDNLYESVWHPINGALLVAHPALVDPDDTEDTSNTTVSGQLNYLWDKWLALKPFLAEDGAAYLQNAALASRGADVSAQLASIDSAINALQAYDTTLYNMILGVVAGELETIPHNMLPNRDAESAHPMTAITGLSTTLADLSNEVAEVTDDLANLVHADIGGRTAADAHPVEAITYDGEDSLADKLNAMDAIISALSGGAVTIAHNDTTNRTAANAHPISAITGLQTALDTLTTGLATLTAALALKLNITDAANTYQRKVLSGTAVPSSDTGVDGDTYLRY